MKSYTKSLKSRILMLRQNFAPNNKLFGNLSPLGHNFYIGPNLIFALLIRVCIKVVVVKSFSIAKSEKEFSILCYDDKQSRPPGALFVYDEV